ncbi:MAG: hypothetical protein ACRCWM_06360 [Sarcina sp.]
MKQNERLNNEVTNEWYDEHFRYGRLRDMEKVEYKNNTYIKSIKRLNKKK